MPPAPSCLCGQCQKCKRRVYMRNWYHRNVDHAKAYNNERRIYTRSGGLKECVCDRCGTKFTATARQVDGHGRRFCTRECKGRARNEQVAAANLLSKPQRFCRHCGVEMARTMRADAVFCSEKCNAAAHMLKRGNGRLGPGRRRDIERAYIMVSM